MKQKCEKTHLVPNVEVSRALAERQEQDHKRAGALAALRAKQAEKEARKTPEERDQDRRAGLLLTSVLGMVAAISERSTNK